MPPFDSERPNTRPRRTSQAASTTAPPTAGRPPVRARRAPCWRPGRATCSADRDVTAAVLIVGGGVAAAWTAERPRRDSDHEVAAGPSGRVRALPASWGPAVEPWKLDSSSRVLGRSGPHGAAVPENGPFPRGTATANRTTRAPRARLGCRRSRLTLSAVGASFQERPERALVGGVRRRRLHRRRVGDVGGRARGPAGQSTGCRRHRGPDHGQRSQARPRPPGRRFAQAP
jgi:hypothetical protein